MATHRRVCVLFLGLFLLSGVVASVVRAADPAGSSPTTTPTSSADRLFRAFAEEAAVIETQWWEGQAVFTSANPADSTIVGIVAALQPWKHVELGGRVGFGSTNASGTIPDGSGATDLDLWGKYDFGTVGADTQFAAGALVTIPTGDDTAGLGHDSFDTEVFGSIRHRLTNAIISANTGFRLNGDGHIHGASFDGKTSWLLGVGLIVPTSDRVSVVGEIDLETDRVKNGDSDFRILGGANWRAFNRGIFRGAVAVGLTDAAPDAQLTVGYAYTF